MDQQRPCRFQQETEKKQAIPEDTILRANRLQKVKGSRVGVRENSFVENLLCTRHFQSAQQLCKAGIILFPKLNEIN